MKEEIKRIMNLVKEGKLSPEDAAELIDAFNSSEQEGATPPPPPSDAAGAGQKDPLKSVVDFVEGLGKDLREKVDWKGVANELKDASKNGFEGLKTSFENIKKGDFNLTWFSTSETKVVELPLIIPEGKLLRIENSRGSILVQGGAENGIAKATANVRGADREDAMARAEDYTLIIEETEHEVLIRQPDSPGLDVDMEVHVVGAVPLEVKTNAGNLTVVDTGSSCRVSNSSGDTQLSGLNGVLEVASQSGSVKIDRSKASTIALETTSGDVRMTYVQGNMRIRSASGGVSLKECSGKTFAIETVSGAVTLDLNEPVSGNVNIRTVSGETEIGIPDGSDCRVSLSTIRGTVDSSIQFGDEAKSDTHLTGTIGDGSGTLDISSVSGSVHLVMRTTASQPS